MALFEKLFGQIGYDLLDPSISFGWDAFIKRRYLRNSHGTILDCRICATATPTFGARPRLNSRAEVRLVPAVAAEERRAKVQTDPQVALPDEAARPQAAEAVADLPDVCPALFDRVEWP